MSPLVLSDLPVASSAVDGDLMLLRKGLTDYQINVSLVRAINLSVYSSLGFAVNNDLMLIQRGASTFNIRFNQVGLVKGVRIWFYLGAAPLGWAVVPNTGDRLLASATIVPAVKYGNGLAGLNIPAGSQGGTWQQLDHVLTIDEMPSHNHTFKVQSSPTGGNTSEVSAGKNSNVGTKTTTNTGGGQGHNHGSSWRPLANVGIICEKSA